MSVSITKGASLNITKAAQDAGAKLEKLVAGAGWDTETDLDLVAVLLGTDGKAIPDVNGDGSNADEALVFFNNKDVKGAHHTGDNRTGEGEGDDEQIVFTLADLPANVQEVALTIASYGTNGTDGKTFGEVEGAFVRLVNSDGDTELGKYDLKDKYAAAKAVEMGRIVREGDGWNFKATGVEVAGDFLGVVTSYGIHGLS